MVVLGGAVVFLLALLRLEETQDQDIHTAGLAGMVPLTSQLLMVEVVEVVHLAAAVIPAVRQQLMASEHQQHLDMVRVVLAAVVIMATCLRFMPVAQVAQACQESSSLNGK